MTFKKIPNKLNNAFDPLKTSAAYDTVCFIKLAWDWAELTLRMSNIHSFIHITPCRLLIASLRLGVPPAPIPYPFPSPPPSTFHYSLPLFIACSRLHHTICNLHKVKMMHISVFLRQFAFIDFLWFSPHAHTHTRSVWRQCLRSSSSLRAALHVFWMTLSAAMQTFSNEHLVQIDWTQAQLTGQLCGCVSVRVCVCADSSFLAFYCMPITCYFFQLSFSHTAAQRVAPWISLESPLLNQSWHYALH